MLDGKMIESMGEKRPTTLDIVSIDGKWGQIVGIINNKQFTIIWLKDKTVERVNLEKYKLEKVDALVSTLKKEFGDEEIQNIHYDADSKNNDDLKHSVVVFGRYTKT